MVRKALHVAWKAGKEVFAMTSHVRPLFHLTRRTLQWLRRAPQWRMWSTIFRKPDKDVTHALETSHRVVSHGSVRDAPCDRSDIGYTLGTRSYQYRFSAAILVMDVVVHSHRGMGHSISPDRNHRLGSFLLLDWGHGRSSIGPVFQLRDLHHGRVRGSCLA